MTYYAFNAPKAMKMAQSISDSYPFYTYVVPMKIEEEGKLVYAVCTDEETLEVVEIR